VPIYTYKCPKHGKFDVLIKSFRDFQEKLRCPIELRRGACAKVSENVPALCAMKPDKYWHFGKYIPTLDRTFNSEREYKTFLKSTDRREAEPGDSLQVTRAVAKKEEKLDKVRHDKIWNYVKDLDV
jgi:hypothetical protein